jgi:UDP-N-acetylmuramate dehydrogenase
VNAAAFREQLRVWLPAGGVLDRERLDRHTTFQVGGPADWLIEIRTVNELTGVLAAARDADVPVTLLGGGSNVIVSDDGLPGAVIRVRLTSIEATSATGVRAGAGVTMNGLVRWTVGRGLAGLEAWAGTPGTVGGAIYGNAHYGGRDIGDRVTQVQVASRGGALSVVPAADLEFGYDASRLQRTGEILVWAEFAVGPGDPDDLRAVARASLAHRKLTQPSCERRLHVPDLCPAATRCAEIRRRPGLIVAPGSKLRGRRRISRVHTNLRERQRHHADIWQLAGRSAVREQFSVELL